MAANILVVEDEPAIQELIAVNLQHAGHHVMRAGDAEGALGIVRNALPDLLLIDWMLPGMSGVSLARQLRQEERTRQIILFKAEREIEIALTFQRCQFSLLDDLTQVPNAILPRFRGG